MSEATTSFLSNLVKKILTILLKNIGLTQKKVTHNQHVVPHLEKWAIRSEGSSKITEQFDYQDDAIERAKQIAYNYKSAVIIHRKDGSIRDRINMD